MKLKDYAGAKKELKSAKSDLETIGKYVMNMDSTYTEKMIGAWLQSLMTIVSVICVTWAIPQTIKIPALKTVFKGKARINVLSFLSTLGIGIGGPLCDAIKNEFYANDFKKDESKYKLKRDKTSSIVSRSINYNQAYVYGVVKDLIKVVDKLSSRIDEIEKGDENPLDKLDKQLSK